MFIVVLFCLFLPRHNIGLGPWLGIVRKAMYDPNLPKLDINRKYKWSYMVLQSVSYFIRFFYLIDLRPGSS